MEKKENTVEIRAERKPVSNIGDNVLVLVQSGFYGKLVYMSRKSGDMVIWENPGDVQIMSMRDLREMKAEQVGFFKNQWVIILSVADGEKCKATSEDIYRSLIVSQYYENFINPSDFEEVCGWDDATLRQRVPLMSQGAKDNLAVALNGFINDGKLDSIKKIKLFAEVLNCDFDQIK